MDYLVPLLLLVSGSMAMVQAQSCDDKSAMNNCLKNLQEYENSLNLFTDKDNLETECRMFNESMKCLDEYLDKCGQADKREEIDSRMSSVRTAVNNLCNDPQLKEDLLYNRECYKMVSDDWAECIKSFQATNQRTDLCSVRDTVIKCGHDSAVKQCSEAAAKSVCKMSANLMGMIVSANSCKSDPIEICSLGVTVQPTLFLLFTAIALGMKILWKEV
ncbi:uncharacterized protein [Anabrus simplex]|uniref:uncharacterized protein n=1 Tax=Anabrus simplex TaxID=316456 RepID=UPI0035A333F3